MNKRTYKKPDTDEWMTEIKVEVNIEDKLVGDVMSEIANALAALLAEGVPSYKAKFEVDGEGWNREYWLIGTRLATYDERQDNEESRRRSAEMRASHLRAELARIEKEIGS